MANTVGVRVVEFLKNRTMPGRFMERAGQEQLAREIDEMLRADAPAVRFTVQIPNEDGYPVTFRDCPYVAVENGVLTFQDAEGKMHFVSTGAGFLVNQQ